MARDIVELADLADAGDEAARAEFRRRLSAVQVDPTLASALTAVIQAVEDCIFYNRFSLPPKEKGGIIARLAEIHRSLGKVDPAIVRAMCFEANERAPVSRCDGSN